MSESNALTTFNEQGLFIIPSTGGWTGKNRLMAKDLGKEEDEIPDCFKLGNKDLLDPETRAKLQRPAARVQSLMDRFCKPFIVGRGIHFCPNSKLTMVLEGLRAIKQEMGETVEAFLSGGEPFGKDYETYKEWRVAEYPVLADAHWPTPDQIRKRFTLAWVAMQMQVAAPTAVDLEEVVAAKKASEESLKEAYDQWADLVLLDAQKAILETCADLREKVEKGEKITASSLKKPKRVIEDYLNVAHIFDLAEVKEKVTELQNLIDATDTAEIRGDFQVGQQFAEALKNLGANIGDLSGLSEDGHVKRIVKKAA